MTQSATQSKKIVGIHTIVTQTETKCYRNKPSPESSLADEENQDPQVTILQVFNCIQTNGETPRTSKQTAQHLERY